ncbi:MAG: formylmethanofuran dehydrogenase subunit C [Planctomycetaceae bacterium]
MPLTITLKQTTSIPIEVDSIRLETVREQSPDQVRATLVQYGNKQPALGEFFDVSGSAAEDNHLVWVGDCAKVKLIGACLSTGQVTVEGNAGMHLGAEMTGGEVICTGNAGDWVGAEMKGGRIRVRGNVGHCVGAVYRGGRRGMTGGEIFIDGEAGNELAHTMRRGLIAVRGSAGDGLAFNMLAGSVFVFGNAGIRPGAGMRRGTIALLGGEAPPLLPTFKYSCTYRPDYLRVYLRHLAQNGFEVPAECQGALYARYNGDFLELGKGEILIRQAA